MSQSHLPAQPSGCIALSQFVSSELDPFFWVSQRSNVQSAWWTHRPFAHWLVSAMQPGVIVELGTYTGVSYSAMCEAVKRLGMLTNCYAVDTWAGDLHMGAYGDTIHDDLKQFNDAHYAPFSTMLRGTFDDALDRFADGSVDLLHIDGTHTYEAVKHDFESWRPKLTPHAVVLFHDTNERRDDFGVWQFWAELCAQGFPHFEFLHGHGLGVLAVGSQVAPAVLQLCAATGTPQENTLRQRFSTLGSMIDQEDHHAQLENLRAELQATRSELHDVKASRAWRIAQKLRKLRAKLGR